MKAKIYHTAHEWDAMHFGNLKIVSWHDFGAHAHRRGFAITPKTPLTRHQFLDFRRHASLSPYRRDQPTNWFR